MEPAKRPSVWNHNTHYHDLVLRSAPSQCRRALDVGCGEGLLARQLAQRCEDVIALDVDEGVLRRAVAVGPERRITFVHGDFMTHPFCRDSFDMITAIAVVHHLPLRLAFTRLRDLLRPGGTLAIIGLYRNHRIEDYAWAAAALPASWTFRRLNGFAEVAAPIRDSHETLREIRKARDAILPGAVLRRRLLFRYSLIWHKP